MLSIGELLHWEWKSRENRCRWEMSKGRELLSQLSLEGLDQEGRELENRGAALHGLDPGRGRLVHKS